MFYPLQALLRRLRSMRNLNPARIVVVSFGIIILTGTLLLMLPWASRDGQSTDLITCLFTATSASCVTGLILVDTWTHWTLFGQVVILAMIQLGGLGFMTVITTVSFALRRRIGLSERLIMVSTLNLNDMDGVVRMVRHTLMGTLIIEGMGAVILTLCFLPEFGLAGGLWRGIFHAVSAFCNAGFDLLGSKGEFTSLITYNGNPVVLLTILCLIVIGGLGFFVWEDLIRNWRTPRRLSLYSKLVILMTGALILGGAVFFLGVEWDNPNTLGGMPWWKKILNSFFQSVTLRTAGFDSIGQGGLRDSSLAMSCILMLIGGSSGSTAGGLKTSTVGILLLTMRAGLAGREEVTIRRRTISQRRVMTALTLTLIVVVLFLGIAMTISLTDDVHFLSAAFEAASALATVGVTVGITPTLTPFSHIILIIAMFLGRVGIMSFSVAFLARGRNAAKIHYPMVDIMIG
ncbi:TrkH family potassium uptake protein [Intestinimonas timonensis]|uniref:TrkH family potassium uptake protein n=1 Tax=Intestinimonas timonensis TaxID=1689270 RepID=UPI003A95BC4B